MGKSLLVYAAWRVERVRAVVTARTTLSAGNPARKIPYYT
jgi:hypothetical protein